MNYPISALRAAYTIPVCLQIHHVIFLNSWFICASSLFKRSQVHASFKHSTKSLCFSNISRFFVKFNRNFYNGIRTECVDLDFLGGGASGSARCRRDGAGRGSGEASCGEAWRTRFSPLSGGGAPARFAAVAAPEQNSSAKSTRTGGRYPYLLESSRCFTDVRTSLQICLQF